MNPDVIRINSEVNDYEAALNDGIHDDWTPISIEGMGDCDSYCTEKYLRLRNVHILPDRMAIATCSTRSGEYHAVLLVSWEDEVYVLDNLTDTIYKYAECGHDFHYVPDYMKELIDE